MPVIQEIGGRLDDFVYTRERGFLGRLDPVLKGVHNIVESQFEQESLDVGIFGSADGATWDAAPIVAFPQKFYCEESPLLLNLTARPEIKFVRAQWTVGRWGRGSETPMFEFHVTLREVPQEILAEAAGRVRLS